MPAGAKCGTTTSAATSAAAPAATAIAAPALGARWRTAYQTPIAATASPTCSFVAIAAAASSANAHSRPWSRCHHANRSSGHASATGWKSLTVSHCTGGERRYATASASRGPVRDEMCLRASQKTGSAPAGDRDRLDDEQQLGIGPEPPERREQGQDRVEVRAEPRDLLAVDVRDREEVAVGGRPDRLRHVAEVEAAALESAVPEHGGRSEAAGEGGCRDPDEDGRVTCDLHRATSRSTRPSQRAPRTASLACSR